MVPASAVAAALDDVLETQMLGSHPGPSKSEALGVAQWRFVVVVAEGGVGFPGASAGKESTCNAGDSGSIPGSGRSAGEGISYPLQYSWASLVAQMVKNLPTVQKTGVQGLGRSPGGDCGNPLQSSCLENAMDRGAWQATVHRVAQSQAQVK